MFSPSLFQISQSKLNRVTKVNINYLFCKNSYPTLACQKTPTLVTEEESDTDALVDGLVASTSREVGCTTGDMILCCSADCDPDPS